MGFSLPSLGHWQKLQLFFLSPSFPVASSQKLDNEAVFRTACVPLCRTFYYRIFLQGSTDVKTLLLTINLKSMKTQTLSASPARFTQLAGYLPLLAIGLFVVIYMLSASLYPGGSQADLTHEGFDWVHNYWCNLTKVNSMNGALNPARPYAITGLVTLCVGLGIFFYQFGATFSFGNVWRRSVQVCGVLAAGFGAMVFTPYHDLMTILASGFGFLTILGVMVGITQNKFRFFQWAGGVCLFLLALNNYIYFSKDFIVTLPLLQKFTFLIILLWIVGLNVKLIQLKKRNNRRAFS